MKINEAYNSDDRLVAKLKGLEYNFAHKEQAVEYYCKELYIPGNMHTIIECNNTIDSLIVDIDYLLNNEFEDERLVLFQENALLVKNRLIELKKTFI